MDSPWFDPSYLRICSGGDLEFERELLDLFVADAQDRLVVIKTAIATQDCETVYRQVHQIKGASGNIGALRLQTLALQLEQAAKQGWQDHLPELCSALEAAFAAIVSLAETWPLEDGSAA